MEDGELYTKIKEVVQHALEEHELKRLKQLEEEEIKQEKIEMEMHKATHAAHRKLIDSATRRKSFWFWF